MPAIALLTRTEKDFLLGTREFSKGQQHYTRYRLNKKLKVFVNEELGILQEKGYLLNVIVVNSSGATTAAAAHANAAAAGCYVSKEVPNNTATFTRLCKA